MKKSLNKLFFTVGAAGLLTLGSCTKTELDQVNPNAVTPASLRSDEGFNRAGTGIYSKFGLEYWWFALTAHNAMGDVTFVSAGNFAWRWVNQPTRIILDNGDILTPPQGGTQIAELKARNTRAFGNDNTFYNEWLPMYLVNNQANAFIVLADDNSFRLSGNEAVRRATMKAWAYWWKGFAYSRIGSLYIAGVITDVVDRTNADYVTKERMIEEANANFDKCAAELDKINDLTAYNTQMGTFIPSFLQTTGGTGMPGTAGIPTPEQWKRHINTYKARNLLVSKRTAQMTAADWNSLLTLTDNGLRSNDAVFILRTQQANAPLTEANAGWSPWRLLTGVWEFVSERWVQEFYPGDLRRARNIVARTSPVVNNTGRGFQYGTRWNLVDITNGGNYASQTAGQAWIPIACSYEENALTRAEALIQLNRVEEGLALIDQVRTFQNAGLAPTVGTSLTQAQAYEVLRRERRIALFLKNTAFYDARRWGWAVANGQRTGVTILGPGGAVNTNATIVYNYLEYFDVPANDIDFNPPSASAAPVVFQ